VIRRFSRSRCSNSLRMLSRSECTTPHCSPGIICYLIVVTEFEFKGLADAITAVTRSHLAQLRSLSVVADSKEESQ